MLANPPLLPHQLATLLNPNKMEPIPLKLPNKRPATPLKPENLHIEPAFPRRNKAKTVRLNPLPNRLNNPEPTR